MLFTQSSTTPLIRGLSIVLFNILSSNVSEVVFKLKTPAAYFVSMTQFVTSLNNSVNAMDVDLFDLNPQMLVIFCLVINVYSLLSIFE